MSFILRVCEVLASHTIRLMGAESHSLGSASEIECSQRSIPRRRLRSDSV
jgi:hypothetical protein